MAEDLLKTPEAIYFLVFYLFVSETIILVNDDYEEVMDYAKVVLGDTGFGDNDKDGSTRIAICIMENPLCNEF